MKIYLVGGAVRDQLLCLPIKDKDWLVVGATPQELIAQGFQPVGKDFPVFLHPQTKEEYALARTERKMGQGYTGFHCNYDPSISLEQDLLRRDLTINAIAQDTVGNLYDPYNGITDLKLGILRHISPAFSEDPLRVLRVARFAARFHYLGFTIANETLELMRQISQSGELASLSAERIWLETEKALNEQHPEVYFQTLHQVGALAILLPELAHLEYIPTPYQTEIDYLKHTLTVLQQASRITKHHTDKSKIRFATLCQHLPKALIPLSTYPQQDKHEKNTLMPVLYLCQRLKVPNEFKQLALIGAEYHNYIHQAYELSAERIISLFDQLDAWRKPKQLENLLILCEADNYAQLNAEPQSYPAKTYIWQLYQYALTVNIQEIIADGYEKQAIKQELHKRRVATIKQYVI